MKGMKYGGRRGIKVDLSNPSKGVMELIVDINLGGLYRKPNIQNGTSSFSDWIQIRKGKEQNEAHFVLFLDTMLKIPYSNRMIPSCRVSDTRIVPIK